MNTATIPYALLLDVYNAAVYRAHYDPQTFFTGERDEAKKLIAQMNEFVLPDDQYRG
jgi:hypothetical protein